jgi:hypothetical protein
MARLGWGSLLALVAVVAASAGCLGLDPAQVPADLVQGGGGNGWRFNDTASDDEPQSRSFGLVRFQSLSYEDKGDEGGYPARLSLTTLRTVLAPSEEDLRDRARTRVRERAAASGITLEDDPETGSRILASDYESLYFVYDGNATQAEGDFFTRDAPVKILGEVWTCSSSRTSVAVVGLAQVADVRYVGGNAIVEEPDDRNWREIVADPDGSIEGVTGRDGLVYNMEC